MLSSWVFNYKESLEEIFPFQSGMLMLRVNLVFALDHKMLKQLSQVSSRTRKKFLISLFLLAIINLCAPWIFLFISLRVCYWFRYIEDFEILHGDLLGLSDTMSFLKSLAELNTLYDSGKNAEKRQMRERTAAAGLFNWEVSYIWIIFI